MSLPRNSQRRLQSSTRIDLARDLHDSLAQELVAIGFSLDLLIAELPIEFRNQARQIRFKVTAATNKVRKDLFALRQNQVDFPSKLMNTGAPLNVITHGNLNKLNALEKRVILELVQNAASHSKGRNIQVTLEDKCISVSDDGQGFFGVCELVEQLGGKLEVTTTPKGTRVEIRLK
jgi:NarL family two-component system sensor histidine kinase LiaS